MKRTFNFSFVLIYFLIILCSNFCHTEKTLAGDDNCPACNFQRSSSCTSHIDFFQLPQLSIIGILETFESVAYHKIFIIDLLARSPPQT